MERTLRTSSVIVLLAKRAENLPFPAILIHFLT